MCELISQRGTMLLGIILELKGNPPAGDGGLQRSGKEGTRSENKVSDTFSSHRDDSWFYFITHASSLLLSLFLGSLGVG